MTAIFELFALMDITKMAKVASIRRGMSATDVAKLGDQVKPVLDAIDAIKSVSRCAK